MRAYDFGPELTVDRDGSPQRPFAPKASSLRLVNDRRPRADLTDLRIGDLATFLAVVRARSITRAARELDVTPSQVSKTIARIEGRIGRELVRRGARGVELTEAGEASVPLIETIFEQLGRLERQEREGPATLTVAAPSFLCSVLFPAVISALPQHRIRGIELPPAALRAHPSDGVFDVLVVTGSAKRMLPAWSVVPIGAVRKGLLCSPKLAEKLGKGPVSPKALLDVPFLTPVYNLNGQLVASEDDCPLSPSERKSAHEVQTLACALETVADNDYVVFGPVCAARRLIDAGIIVEVPVRGWDVREECVLAVNPDRVLSRVRNTLAEALAARLVRLHP